jgi:murein endopeptidase
MTTGRLPAEEPKAEQTSARPHEVSGDKVRIAFLNLDGSPIDITFQRRSRSVGSPTRGRLENPNCIPDHGAGFISISKARCGTDETIALITYAVSELMRRYPDTVPMVIGAISGEDGDRLRPHRSHRTGRDVDIGYFAKNNQKLAGFVNIPIDQIDFEKTFFVMATLMATGRVDYIFVNYALQKRFYETARAFGYDDQQLSYMFQYPQGKKARVGIIRHARGHLRHFHVRFSCPIGDETCVQE